MTIKTSTFKSNGATAAALLLVLPATYFIFINVISEIGFPGPANAMDHWLVNSGLQGNFAVDYVIILGPLITFLLTIFQVMSTELRATKEAFFVNMTFQKRWIPLLLAVFSGAMLAFMMLYYIVDKAVE